MRSFVVLLPLLAPPALAEESSTAVVQAEPVSPDQILEPDAMVASEPVPADYQATRAALGTHRDTLAKVLATKDWYVGPQLRDARIELTDVLSMVEPLFDRIRVDVYPTAEDDAVAASFVRRHGEFSKTTWTRSRYKALQQDSEIVALAFGVQRASQGRGVAYTSTDVLVLLDDGVPTEVFSTTTHPWGTGAEEHHFALTRDRAGRIVQVTERATIATSGHRKVLRGPQDGRPDTTSHEAFTRSWTRS